MKRKLLFAIVALLCSVGLNAQKDVTSQYITNATLSDGTNGWTKTHTKTTQTNDPADAFSNSVRGNNTVGYASEAYAGYGSLIQTAYSMKQTITLPAGNYRLVCYAFFRQGVSYNTNSSKSLAKLKAGATEVALKTLGSITAAGYANTQAEGANCFDSKMYRNVVEFTSDGSPIEIGIEGTFDEMRSWCIVGQFELFDLDDLASVSSPTDVTYAITNPGFEYRDLTGWSREQNPSDDEGRGSFWYMNNTALSGKAGIGWVESYKGGGIPNGRTIYQDLTGLDNGLYEVTVYGHLQQGSGSDGFYLYANSDKVAIGSTDKDYSVRTTVTDGNLRIKLGTESCNGNWAAFDKVRLQFYGDPLEAYKVLLADAVSNAGTLKNSAVLSDAQKAAWQAIIDANDNDDNAFTEESEFNTAIENIGNANTLFQSLVAPYASFNALKTAANIIADVEYIEKSSGSHTTYTDAVSAQTSAADNATTVSAVNTAYSTLKSAIKTYISSAEPKNEGEYFDITCLIENPSFEANNATGWSGDTPGFESYANAEFFNKNFDFYQDLSGLPQGSYQLSVQAFCRPGDNGSTSAGAYYDYYHGTNNITAELYLNNGTTTQASKVGNIYAYKDNTTGAKVVGNDFHCEISPDNYWVPNNMKGAGLYFEDGAYTTEVAALVDASGTLKIGFRENSKKTNQWVIFDNFKLYYYGSSKMRYYQQYLPQLRAEVSEDLSNALYTNVLTSSEDEALDAALEADPAEETEEAYKDVIDALLDAQTTFRAAATAYDAMVAAKASSLTKITANIGTGVFQYNEATNNSLYSAYQTAKGNVDGYTFTTSSTAAGAQTLVDALDDAIEAYNNQPLNAPSSSTRYKLVLADRGALSFDATGAADEGGYGLPYSAAADYKAQTFFLTQVTGNNYKLSFEDFDGNTRYICKGENAKAGLGNNKIRTTTDAEKALEIKIAATSTANVFNMLNTADSNNKLGSDGGGMYTANNYTSWSITEASQASVTVSCKAGKFGTVIFPFTPVVSSGFDGITFYSAESVNSATQKVQLSEVTEPVANVPYLIKNDNGEDFSKNDVTGWGTATADSYTDAAGLLTGVYTNANINGDNRYVLQTPTSGENEGVQAFYKVNGDFTATPYKCYLTYNAGGSVKFLGFDFGDATGISEVANGEQPTANSPIFNLAGQRVSKAQKGLYIVNGKKVMVK